MYRYLIAKMVPTPSTHGMTSAGRLDFLLDHRFPSNNQTASRQMSRPIANAQQSRPVGLRLASTSKRLLYASVAIPARRDTSRDHSFLPPTARYCGTTAPGSMFFGNAFSETPTSNPLPPFWTVSTRKFLLRDMKAARMRKRELNGT
jgi:hypothetical protein